MLDVLKYAPHRPRQRDMPHFDHDRDGMPGFRGSPPAT